MSVTFFWTAVILYALTCFILALSVPGEDYSRNLISMFILLIISNCDKSAH
jgi:hypothetical protein